MRTDDVDDGRPPAAEQARTAMASARVACLTTYPRGAPGRPHLTSVVLVRDDDGCPVVRLAAGSPAAAHLLSRPLATVRVAPVGCAAVTVHGSVRRLALPDDDAGPVGPLHYRVEVGAVRLGDRQPVPLPAEQYLAARPDPLHDEAAGVLAHLSQAHGAQLTACLRARGHEASWVEPRSLDSRGLDVLVVGPAGVELVRLAFPAPVARLADLGAGLAAPMLCRCTTTDRSR